MGGIMAEHPVRVPEPATMLHVILFRPQIPPNTGNIIRLCANSGCVLHLVRPLGFDLQARAVRRAGLDYDELASVRVHAGLAACLDELQGARVFSVETGATRLYTEVAFEPGDALVFGSETSGLPVRVLQRIPAGQQLTIPMRPGNRSINLSNAVALVVYEAWRQNGFCGRAP
jgi:tRNA (cytidine/uridine-2'-O-)-methyltransferase